MAMNLANLVTLGNSVSGIFSMFLSFKGQFAQAAYLIYLGMGLDILDGKIDRKFKPTQSGKYFDSISDLISFGVAPAVLVGIYFSSMKIFIPIGIVYAFCCLVRLVRFSTRPSIKPYFFNGLPAPVAAGCVVSFFLVFYKAGIPVPPWALIVLMAVICYLMLSSILYEHLGHMLGRIKVLYRALFLLLWVACWLTGTLFIFLFMMFFSYLVCGLMFQGQLKKKIEAGLI